MASLAPPSDSPTAMEVPRLEFAGRPWRQPARVGRPLPTVFLIFSLPVFSICSPPVYPHPLSRRPRPRAMPPPRRPHTGQPWQRAGRSGGSWPFADSPRPNRSRERVFRLPSEVVLGEVVPN
jgi:hypothetical protein